VWSTLAAKLTDADPHVLIERARLLGVPVGRVGEATQSHERAPVLEARLGEARSRPDVTGLVVIDLSALWAGPLCGDLLAGAGATVVKVESTQRPDGARRGTREFFDLLNGQKRSVALDLQSRQGVRVLRALVNAADIVIEASRPRALAQFGLDAGDIVAGNDGPQIWVSITGYGRNGAGANRVAFGDDAAAAGGLVTWTDERPLFCGDAVADPLTGLTAAGACINRLRTGGRWLLDVAMAPVSADLAGPTLPTHTGLIVAAPHARPVIARAPELGADTAQVLAELDIEA
jgi:crotonobetainyl-CoA:carnitine CoA-transferase CaiB-like acyl-CoA transferase